MVNRILGIASYVGMGLVFGALAVRILRPEWDQYAIYAAWTGLALIVLYTLGQWRQIVGYFQHRSARYGALAGASVLIVLGILVAANYLSTRHNVRWDLTENRQYTLSDQTVRLLRELDGPVRFLVFARETEFDRFRTRLTQYEYHSNQVGVEYIDADRRPLLAREYQVEAYGTVVLEYEGRTERVASDSEQDLTNALIRVITGEQPRVYFLQGHGEKSTADTDRTGYSTITEALERDNYESEDLVLAQQPDVPADASVVVVAGPQTDLLQSEADALRRYLAGGGKVLFLIDPPETTEAAQPVLDALVLEWGFELGRDVVVDVSGMGQLLGTDASVPVAARYHPSHPITERFNVLTAYPLARSVTPTDDGMDGRIAQTIIETSERSWAETDITRLTQTGEVAQDEAEGDRPGPISIGAAVAVPVAAPPAEPGEDPDPATVDDEPARPETRVAVIGDSDFAANFAIGIQGNRDLFMNTVSWLAQQEGLIAIRPREPSDRRITLTASQMTGVSWLSIVLLPAAVLGAGVYVWWRRR